MRTVKEVEIIEAIVHKLDNTKDSPILSDFLLDISDNDKKFIGTHIVRSLQDVGIRAARFKTGKNLMKELSDAILDNSDTFVESSKDIASHLFGIMKSNKNISSADIIVCHYQGNCKSYLTVLKLDYQSTHISEVKLLEDGKVKIVMSDKGTSLPGVKQKLQKCVFFQRSSENSEYDLMLIDKQSRGEQEKVANFFANNFLNCELSSNDYTRTTKFHKGVRKWLLKENLPPEDEKRVFDSLVNALKNQANINVVNFASGLFSDEEQSKQFLTFLTNEGLHDYEFTPDKGYVESRFKKRHIKTSDGIEINLSNEDYNNQDKFEAERIGDTGRFNILIKNVSVTKWE